MIIYKNLKFFIDCPIKTNSFTKTERRHCIKKLIDMLYEEKDCNISVVKGNFSMWMES